MFQEARFVSKWLRLAEGNSDDGWASLPADRPGPALAALAIVGRGLFDGLRA